MAALVRSGRNLDCLPMLATASKLIIRHLAAWLAVGMLLLPSVPSSGCTCQSASTTPVGCCFGHHSGSVTRPTRRGDCCSHKSRRACCAAGKPSPTGGSERRSYRSPTPEMPSHSKSDGALRAAAGTTDSCSPSCPCCLSRPTEPPPLAPVTSGRNLVPRVQIVLIALPVLADSDLLSGSRPVDQHLQHFLVGTSLDRCIELSRFTC